MTLKIQATTDSKAEEAAIIADRLKRLMAVHSKRAELTELGVFWDDLEQLITTVLDKEQSNES